MIQITIWIQELLGYLKKYRNIYKHTVPNGNLREQMNFKKNVNSRKQ